MIIKDLVIENKNLFVEVEGFVVIKRDGKHYTVPVRMRHDYKEPNNMQKRLGPFSDIINQFIGTCRRIDKDWKVNKYNNVNTGSDGFVIGEEEFDYNNYE